MASGYSVPPLLTKDSNYNDWKNELLIWQSVTTLAQAKQGGAVFLSLTGQAKEAARELKPGELTNNAGINNLLQKLDSLFLKDETEDAFMAYEDFENFTRGQTMSHADYLIEFERRYAKIEKHKMKLPDGVKAYRLLKSSNLSDTQKQLVRATLPKLEYTLMKDQLKKIFGDSVIMKTEIGHDDSRIRVDPQFYGEQSNHDNSYPDDNGNYDYDDENYDDTNYDERNYGYGDTNYDHDDGNYDSYYTNSRGNNRERGRFPPRNSQGYNQNRSYNRAPSSRSDSNNWRERNPQRNRLDSNGNVSKCINCGSTFHWVRDCPDRNNSYSYGNSTNRPDRNSSYNYGSSSNRSRYNKKVHFDDKIQFYTEEVLQCLVGDTLSMAILDSGCTRTVCGENWLNCYLETLTENEKALVQYSSSTAVFKFGDGKHFKSKKHALIPVEVVGKQATIATDVIDGDIPLLLSKTAMKNADVKMDFTNDKISILGIEQDIQYNATGHCCIPLSKATGHPIDSNTLNDVLYNTMNIDDLTHGTINEKRKIAMKLHRQFSHANAKKLKILIKEAGKEDEVLFKEIDDIVENCEVCIKYKKPKPRPIVGLPMGRCFNETIAMDLKEWSYHRKIWLLHIVDHATRYSSSCVIYNKRRETIIENVFKIWIGIFGAPGKILVDNGGEFANEDYLSMGENLNTTICTTPAKSPWSNGLVERHNGVLGDMLTKVMSQEDISLSTGVAWCVAAKNALKNVNGFSPNQLVFGRNPNFPSTIDNRPPALEGKTTSEIVAENLNAMHTARKAFIESESSEKLRRALRHQTRTSTDTRYITGDVVYYKRKDDLWKGPGIVIGQQGNLVFVKHGSQYVTVHPCRLMMKNNVTNAIDDQGQHSNSPACSNQTNIIDEDDDVEQPNSNPDEPQDTTEINDHITLDDDPDIIDHNANNNNSEESITQYDYNRAPKRGQHIKYMCNGTNQWITGKIHSRAGKVGRKYEDFFNIINDTTGQAECIDWKTVEKWHLVDIDGSREQEQIIDESNWVYITENACNKSEILDAKMKELDNWKINDVYNEVPDQHQKCISSRWVLTEKNENNKRQIKARLVAKGYEEDLRKVVDSPTCTKEAFRMTLAIIATKNWKCNSIDIKAAFLQGKSINRDVYLKPPKEFRVHGTIWKLKTTVYGLNDASRIWYMRVKDVLSDLGVKMCSYDAALFYWYNGSKLEGIMSTHVDDFCWAGTNNFIANVINPMKTTFQVGAEHNTAFKYLGLNINQTTNGIELDQNSYLNTIEQILINKERTINKDSALTEDEIRDLRTLTGQLNWLGNQSRPDILFDCCILMSSINKATVNNLMSANKLLLKTKMENVILKFSPIKDISKLRLIAYCDASLANLNDGNSQGAYIIFLSDEPGELAIPISWQSRKLKRIVKSTFGAETLSLIETADACIWIESIISEVLYKNCGNKLKITIYTDCKNLFESAYSTKPVLDKRLRVDIAAIRQMIDRNKIHEIKWIDKCKQLADCMTKKGAPSANLLRVLSFGRFC